MIGAMAVTIDDSGAAYLVRALRPSDGWLMIVDAEGYLRYVNPEICRVVQSMLPAEVDAWWTRLQSRAEHTHEGDA